MTYPHAACWVVARANKKVHPILTSRYRYILSKAIRNGSKEGVCHIEMRKDLFVRIIRPCLVRVRELIMVIYYSSCEAQVSRWSQVNIISNTYMRG